MSKARATRARTPHTAEEIATYRLLCALFKGTVDRCPKQKFIATLVSYEKGYREVLGEPEEKVGLDLDKAPAHVQALVEALDYHGIVLAGDNPFGDEGERGDEIIEHLEEKLGESIRAHRPKNPEKLLSAVLRRALLESAEA